MIQDELHLISGPLGTMAGLYETAIEALCAREIDGRPVRPKIIASTATVRRAQDQIQALFARPLTQVFPPPGPDRCDSFFARTLPSSEVNARLYMGIACQGRKPPASLPPNPPPEPPVRSPRPLDSGLPPAQLYVPLPTPAAPPTPDPVLAPERVPTQPAVIAPPSREQDLAERYTRAMEAMKQRSYREAVTLLEDLERDSPGYRDAAGQLPSAREGLRAETQSALERDLAAAQAKQLEAERAAAEAARLEAGRQTQIRAQQEAAARFFAAIMGTWTHEEDQRTEESRTRTEELLTIGSGCSGVLTRTVSTYKRGFAGWQRMSSEPTRFTIRCDGTGRVSGDLNSQISLQGAALLLGTSTFSRRR